MAPQSQSPEPLRLHNSYTFWISRLASAMQEQFNRDLEAMDVTWPQWMVMNVLNHSGVDTPAKIAEHIGVDRSAVTRLLDRLEKKGFLHRVNDQVDRRSVKVEITEPGKMLLTHMDQLAEKHQRSFLGELHPTEYRAFKNNLQKLLRAAEVETAHLWKHA